jgi:hypothetical protein
MNAKDVRTKVRAAIAVALITAPLLAAVIVALAGYPY